MRLETLIGRGLLGEDRLIAASGGRWLRAMVAGTGDDLVVLEAGLGVSGLYWGPVHAALARHVRVVAYERAGFGGSTPASREGRGLADLAADLATIVDAFPHRRLVLVGHSWGGPIVRTYAASTAAADGSLSGVVLVDQSDEHAADLYTSVLARWSDRTQNALFVPLARARLLGPLMRTQLVGLPPEILRAALAASSTIEAARATVRENRDTGESVLRLQAEPPALGRIGLRVISGQQHNRVDRRIRALLVHAHRQTASEHPGAQFVPAEQSGHMIPVTEPDLIAEQALALLRSSP